jgi:DMSO/TMAO reductase YedYZ molybdopterin-dependent catalytic subunit
MAVDRRIPRSLVPPPAVVDWCLLATVLLSVGTGLYSLVVGTRAGAWVFLLHAVGGVWLVGLLAWKFRRVAGRLAGAWTHETVVSAALGAVALASLATGLLWVHADLVRVFGGTWTLLTLHAALGVLVVPLLAWHLRHRFRVPARADVTDRRAVLGVGATVAAGAVVWRLQGLLNAALGLAGRRRRFTGSKEDGSDDGNAFPVTSWVADDPDPVDPAAWSLTVDGLVGRELDLSRTALSPDEAAPGDDPDALRTADERALLDCTSGWYSVHDWSGVRVGDLLDAADPDDDAAWVRFVSVTGYRWSLPIEEGRDAVLATAVDGDPLSHGHGAPLRLVAPGRRGFQWVKWVTRVELRRERDPGQWIATLVSGLD